MWTGLYSCVECDETFIFQREDITMPDGVYFQVVHQHDVVPPRWEGTLYRHAKGMRYPDAVKDEKATIASQKKAKVKKRQKTNLHTREGQS